MVHSIIALSNKLLEETYRDENFTSCMGITPQALMSDYKKAILLLAQKLNEEETETYRPGVKKDDLCNPSTN